MKTVNELLEEIRNEFAVEGAIRTEVKALQAQVDHEFAIIDAFAEDRPDVDLINEQTRLINQNTDILNKSGDMDDKQMLAEAKELFAKVRDDDGLYDEDIPMLERIREHITKARRLQVEARDELLNVLQEIRALRAKYEPNA